MLCRLYTIFDYYFRIKIVVQQHTVHSWRCATTCEHRPTKQTLLVAIFHSFPNSPLSIRSIHIQICRTAAYNVLYTMLCCMPYGFATIFCNMSACFHSPPFFLTVKLFTPRLLIVTATFILSIVFAIDITVFFSSTIFIPFFPLYLTIFDFIDIGGFCWFYYYYYNFLFPFRCVHKINESIVMFREVFVRPQRQWRRPRRRWRRFLCVFLCESKRPPRLAQSQIPLLFCVCSWVWEYHVQCPVCGCVSFVIANIIAFTSQPPVNHGMDSLTQRTIVSPHLESNSNEQ